MHRSLLLTFALSLVALTGRVTNASEQPEDGWLLLGNFRGTTSSALLQRLNDYLFEEERSGDLYQDLGDVSLGIGFDIGDDGSFDWDNAFHRRVRAFHHDLPPGATVESADLSSFVDIQGSTSRVKIDYTVPADQVGGVGVGAGVEGGVSLTLARFRQPLVWGDRPLSEVLAERDKDDFRELVLDQPPIDERSLVRLASQGIGAIARPVAHAFEPTIDTEQGKIFHQNIVDPVTLLGDVGIPVPAELFRARDERLGVGDRIRHVSFRGISPIRLGYQDFGFTIDYSAFIRALRETTIIKEPGDQVLVRVREMLAKGQQARPIKFRPEIRLLGIVTLGYTFLEQRLARAQTFGTDTLYRLDLANSTGLRLFEDLLQEGSGVSFHPLARAASGYGGAEIVHQEARRGGRRTNVFDLGIFSPFGFKDRHTLTSDLVQVGDLTLREMNIAGARQYRKRIGRDRDWDKRFLVTAQGPESWRSEPETPVEREAGTFAVNMLTGYRSDQTPGSEVRRQIDLLERTLGPHPVLDEVGSIPHDVETRFISNLRLSFGAHHLKLFAATSDEELWLVLAELFLGPEFREDWATESNRTEWSGRSNRRAFLESLPEGLQSLSQPREKVLSLKGRLRLARRAVRKFDRLRELIDDSDCISCMSKTFTKQKDIVVLQMVLFRLASRDSQNPPGYRYEVFIDSMLRPRSVGNGLFFEYGLPTLDLPDGRSESVTSLQQEVDLAEQSAGRSYLGWSGDESFVDPSSPRLQAGEVFLDVSGGDVEGGLRPCWKLRLFSDLEFAADLSLRLDFRLSRAVEADRPIGLTLVPMGDSTEVVQSPFSLSRFSYDVSLPALSEFQPGESYTILMRVLNADGRPVSEEEQVRFEWPAVGFSEAAPECRGGDIDG